MAKKKMKLWVKVLIAILLIVILIVGGVYFYANSLIGKMDKEELNKDELGISNEVDQYENSKDVKNIALFGIDTVDGMAGRSDAIMILTIDKGNNKAKLSSIMRDSYVTIPGRGKDKINHAYAFGGAPLAIRTINENFKLNVDDFIAVNFSSLPKVIDKLGGIELNITEEERTLMNKYINQVNKLDNANAKAVQASGKQHLDGYQALAYSRIRYTSGGDQKRTERQREVLNALFSKAKQTSITEYPSLLNEILPLIKTSMDSTEMISLGKSMATMPLEQKRFPSDEDGKNSMINGVYYMTFDMDVVSKKMQEYIFNDKDS